MLHAEGECALWIRTAFRIKIRSLFHSHREPSSGPSTGGLSPAHDDAAAADEAAAAAEPSSDDAIVISSGSQTKLNGDVVPCGTERASGDAVLYISAKQVSEKSAAVSISLQPHVAPHGGPMVSINAQRAANGNPNVYLSTHMTCNACDGQIVVFISGQPSIDSAAVGCTCAEPTPETTIEGGTAMAGNPR